MRSTTPPDLRIALSSVINELARRGLSADAVERDDGAAAVHVGRYEILIAPGLRPCWLLVSQDIRVGDVVICRCLLATDDPAEAADVIQGGSR